MRRGSWSIRWWLASLVGGVALPLTLLLALSFLAEARRAPREASQWALLVARSLAAHLDAFHSDSLALLDGMALPELLGAETLPAGSVVILFDDRGAVIARSAEPPAALAEIVLREKDGNAEVRGADGIARLYGFTTVSGMRWSVVVGIPSDAILAPARAELARGIAAGAVSMLVLVTIAVLMSRAIERPIVALARTATAVAYGAHGKVSVAGPREIAMLAVAFNEMVEHRASAERNMQALSERMQVVQEEERTRIARELHDDLGQTLTALKMDVIGLMEKTSDTPIRQRVLTALDATVSSVQRIASELRPDILDDLGLVATIESEARAFEERTGIECEVSLPEDAARINNVVATAIYRILQEALTNVARHSNAARVELRVRFRDGDVLIEVRDDGRGITPQEVGSTRSLGLIGIRERVRLVGGTARVEGVAGRGTTLSIRIPMQETAS